MYRVPTIYMSNTTLMYGQKSRLLARLYNAAAATVVTGVTVTFQIDGTTVGTATTADNGSGLTYAQINPYTIDDTLTVGDHTLTASYDGSNGTDLANSKDVTLTVAQTTTNLAGVNAAAKLGDTIALRAKLTRTTDNSAVSGQTVTFSVDGTSVGIGTSVASDGTATFSGYDTSNLSVGTHILTAQFSATTNYKASSSSATLTISKANTTLAANSATRARGQIQVLSARLKNSQNGNYLSGKTVTFKIDGTTVGTGTTGADGYARYSYTVPANATVGAHTITAVFDGDTDYNTSTGSATLTVN